MPRVKRGKTHLRKRKRLLKRVKGYKWGRKNLPKLAKVAAAKAGVHAFRDRRGKKREFRRLWQIKINAASRESGLSYSKLINLLKKAEIILDRKILADLAEHEPKIFAKIVESIKK
ncbi:MAG: 50S ribosomal protein L20 [bacterium]